MRNPTNAFLPTPSEQESSSSLVEYFLPLEYCKFKVAVFDLLPRAVHKQYCLANQISRDMHNAQTDAAFTVWCLPSSPCSTSPSDDKAASLVQCSEISGNMNGYSNPTDYAGQLEVFRKSDADRDALVAEVIEKYEQLQVSTRSLVDSL